MYRSGPGFLWYLLFIDVFWITCVVVSLIALPHLSWIWLPGVCDLYWFWPLWQNISEGIFDRSSSMPSAPFSILLYFDSVLDRLLHANAVSLNIKLAGVMRLGKLLPFLHVTLLHPGLLLMSLSKYSGSFSPYNFRHTSFLITLFALFEFLVWSVPGSFSFHWCQPS